MQRVAPVERAIGRHESRQQDRGDDEAAAGDHLRAALTAREGARNPPTRVREEPLERR